MPVLDAIQIDALISLVSRGHLDARVPPGDTSTCDRQELVERTGFGRRGFGFRQALCKHPQEVRVSLSCQTGSGTAGSEVDCLHFVFEVSDVRLSTGARDRSLGKIEKARIA